MTEPIAYLNGQFLPAHQALLSVYDQGFLLGVTIAEQLRTFAGKLFRVERHLDRLFHSLQVVGVHCGLSQTDFERIAGELAAHNCALLEPGDDLGLTIFITPGILAHGDRDQAAADRVPPRPTVCMHTRPLPFHTWAAKYVEGESLATTDIEQVSARSWPPELKCRSRMHYYLADQQANARYPGARALMLDEHGFATEATTANVLVYRAAEGLLTPPAAKVLPGISLSTVREFASNESIPLAERDLRSDAFATADEVLLCSTSPCVLPVTRFNGQKISDGKPGPIFRRLLSVWSQSVGVDIAAQAERFGLR
jgi:branched-subunit amino acid aminotransferase/4-amino-4-deoxychorismate lyase